MTEFTQIRPGILAMEHMHKHSLPYLNLVNARRAKNAR
jgi:hypothetical protein